VLVAYSCSSVPDVFITPILLGPYSVNQMFPSGPVVIPSAPALEGSGYTLAEPPVVMAPDGRDGPSGKTKVLLGVPQAPRRGRGNVIRKSFAGTELEVGDHFPPA